MTPIEGMIHVPISRFRREMRKWFRQRKPVCITVNGKETSVVIPANSPEFAIYEQFKEHLYERSDTGRTESESEA